MKQRSKKVILTCEHGGAKIPAPYKKLFRGHSEVLKTHRGLDIGALVIARHLQKLLKTSLDSSEVSRLLIDLNRFLQSPTLFSEFTRDLSEPEREKIIRTYYRPHWNRVQTRVRRLLAQKDQVLHIAVHSMTGNLNGQVRPMQLSLLYDPQRKTEQTFAKLWIAELRREFPQFKIARNNPYKGNGEGLTTALRRTASEKHYLGIELEINQDFLKSLTSAKQRKEFSQALAHTVRKAVGQF